jgi:hypothetical protein
MHQREVFIHEFNMYATTMATGLKWEENDDDDLLTNGEIDQEGLHVREGVAGQGGLGDNAREGELCVKETAFSHLLFSTYFRATKRGNLAKYRAFERITAPCYETYHGQTSILELVQLQLLQSLLVFGKTQGIELEVTGLFIQKKRCQECKRGYEWVQRSLQKHADRHKR